jgi:phosphoribosylglycinamide formyltransferase-1
LRLGVLASGTGSNLQSILDACAQGLVPAQVAVVISNLPSAKALDRAREAGVRAISLPHQLSPSREAYDEQLVSLLREHGVELVCLAGFMRLITPVLLHAFENRILNIHPALLPSFPGLHAVRQALKAGVKISGCTVHVVDEGTDTGPIVVQAAVPVLEGDDEESLAARILVQEHRCYPWAIRLWAEGRVAVEGRRVRIATAKGDPARHILSPGLEGEQP